MPKGLIICTLCQRVRRGNEWVDTERMIRELRSYEFESIPQLHSAVCDECVDSILLRRSEPGAALAA
jgi:hypothetical protein